MKNKTLKTGRVILALLFFIPITCYFLDYSGHVPDHLSKILHLQLIPALLSGFFLIVLFILLFTIFFGRIYCSTICPAGILQDIFIRLSGKGKKKTKKHFSHRSPYNIPRYSLLGICILLFLLRNNQLVSFLDPYSNYGRISANIFQPVIIGINNLLAMLLAKAGNYSMYYISIGHITLISLFASISILLIFALFSVFRGRLFCNTLCPVGSLLSLFSRFSLFRITFNESKCNNCGLCERSCKSECIDSKKQTVDISRCVNCFNCIPSCKKGGLEYRFYLATKKKEIANTKSRRSFIVTGAGLIAGISILPSCKGIKKEGTFQSKQPVVPPGAQNRKRFEETCTACHLCVLKCPSKVLKPAGMEYGFNYLLKPHLSYENSYCNYECTICSEICPNHALLPLTTEEKITTQIGVVHFNEDICVVKTEEKDCGACSEHCPTQAVKMVPYKGHLTIPHIEPDICIGCGGCESICPVRPQRAIIIIGNPEHQKVKKPEYEKVKEVEVTDFGF